MLAFNRLFKAIRTRRGESRAVEATWINIAFSYHALTLLTDDATAFTDEAFKQGLAARSADLGDPTEPDAEGNPQNWLIGGPGDEADVVLIVESDDRDDLFAEVARIEHSLYPRRSAGGRLIRSGAVVIFKQQGATLSQPLTGHEHFGFLDGVSQPGMRGRISDNPTDVLTFRQNPNDRDRGAPILRAPEADDRALADDDCANNNFEFVEETPQIFPQQKQSAIDCTDEIPNAQPPALFPPSEGDPDGEICPFAGHIRKGYPRDDTSGTLPTTREVTTQTHRILRRGIPFGEPLRQFPFLDFGERGLVFLAYQTSIVEQFEFILRQWVNNPDFKELQAGHDLIIGQNNMPGAERERKFTITFTKNGIVHREVISTHIDWVIPTGGGYFFAPSIAALELFST